MGPIESTVKFVADVFQIVTGIAAVVIAYAGWRIAQQTLNWERLSDEEKRGVNLKGLLKDVTLKLGQPRDQPGPNLAVSHPDKLKKHKRFFPLVFENAKGTTPDDLLILEVSEPTNRWTFRCDTRKMRIQFWNKVTQATLEEPRKTQFSFQLLDWKNGLGDICLNDLERPSSEGPLHWKLSCNGILIKEAELEIP